MDKLKVKKTTEQKVKEHMDKALQVVVKCTGADVINIDYLQEFQGDLKTLSEENYHKFKEDILELGFSSPIHIWVNDETNYILDGHQRLKTLTRMRDKESYKIPDIPIVFVEADDFKQAKKKVLALTSQFGEITGEGLHEFMKESNIKLNEIKDSFRFPEIDFKKFEIDFILPKKVNTNDPDEVGPPPRKPKSKSGELYILGNHRLLCGDATSEKDMIRLMGEDKADLIVTDPPYNVDYEGGTDEKLKIENDKMDNDIFYDFLLASYKNYFNATRAGGPMYVFHADIMGHIFRGAMIDAEWMMKQCLIWDKDRFVMGRQDYHWKHEPILYGWKPGAAHPWETDRKQSTVLNFNRTQKNDVHPTMKPIDLISYLIKNSSKEGDLVIDFFGGSGSTLISCEATGRRCCSMELDPRFVDVILNRYMEYAEKDPIRLNEDGSQTNWSEISG